MSEDLSRRSIREAQVHNKFEANISNAQDHAIFVGQNFSMVGHQLGRHSLVELTTVNKALLRKQPKPLNYFGHQFFLF